MAVGKTTDGAAAMQTFQTLTIDKRVLITPARTIAVASIATLSVGPQSTHRPRLVYGGLAFAGVAVALKFYFSPVLPVLGGIDPMMLLAIAVALIFAVLAIKRDDPTPYLFVSSTDGVVTRFESEHRELLDQVRDLLTAKINTGNETAAYSVNFAEGRIENLTAGGGAMGQPAPSMTPFSGMPQRSGPVSAQGTAAAYGNAATMAPDGARRGGVADPSNATTRSPSGPFAASSGQNGAPSAQASNAYVDFRALLPAVVEMHRFYARQANTEHLEQRLSELELLMRSGAQTDSHKLRVRELTQDLGQILQAYQPAVQIFQQIGGLAA